MFAGIKKKIFHFRKSSKEHHDEKFDVFLNQADLFEQLDKNKRFTILKSDFFPCLHDATSSTPFDAHYVYHPAWAARIVRAISPQEHIDISSTLHFCSILSAFVKTSFYDFRPAMLNLDNLDCLQADLTSLHFETGSIESLSCMHTIEHIGLGRYGDPIDPDGDLKAINELKRVCTINGNLLIVVPVGVRGIRFNAHRIYAPSDIVEYMDGFKLADFSLVDDSGVFIKNADLQYAATQSYGCGCYWFIKS